MSDGRPDFPYYAGRPTLSGRDWLTLTASLALAFAVLTLWQPRSLPQSLAQALLFAGIPLEAVRLVSGPRWTALFRPVGLRQVGQMALFGALTLAASAATGLLLSQFFAFSPNRASEAIAGMSAAELAARLIPTVPQLFGEELLGVLPFLGALWLCVTRLRLPRLAGIAIALVASSLVFGAAHLPTYDWNWGQALLGIGAARAFLTLAYIATRNRWVSAGAHIVNDWSGFLLAFAAGQAPVAAAG
jgi:membrane protease YdiL (CAAX protease family)